MRFALLQAYIACIEWPFRGFEAVAGGEFASRLHLKAEAALSENSFVDDWPAVKDVSPSAVSRVGFRGVVEGWCGGSEQDFSLFW